MRRPSCWPPALLLLLAASVAGAAEKAGVVGQPAVDFPPGRFTDGNTYALEDLRGKVVVLYFFEPT